MTLLPGAERLAAHKSLQDCLNGLSRVRATTFPRELHKNYLRWVAEYSRAFRYHLRDEDVRRILETRRYWAILSMPQEDETVLAAVVNSEIDQRESELTVDLRELQRDIDNWQGAHYAVVPDTNVFLQHRNKFDDIDWASLLGARAEEVDVIVPLVVVDELDKKKQDSRVLRWRASYSLARINTLYQGSRPPSRVLLQREDWSEEARSSDAAPVAPST